jgi:signal transduction histidine kinase/DNA-binding response OmpR family regulator
MIEPEPDPQASSATTTGQWLGILLTVSALANALFAIWVLATGRIGVMDSAPILSQPVPLYLTLILLVAAPLSLGGAYSWLLTRTIRADAKAMRKARDAAREVARAKAGILATMSHEIRTPLNAMLGFSGLLGKTPLNATQAEYLSFIQESGAHLLSTINDVLDYSKLEAGRIDLDEKAFEIGALVDGCLKAVSLPAAQKGIELGFHSPEGIPPTLYGDATRIRQVLLNLLSNAIKFTPRGKVTVTLRSEGGKDGHLTLHLEVHDTGIGISAAARNRLFRPFSQVDTSPSAQRHGGTGLGLAISQHLCRLMGGDLTVKSRPGQGSTFTATLRLHAASPPPHAQKTAPQALRGLRLLVVDTNVADRALICRNAQAWGMLPRGTGDPHQAAAWVRSGDPFDLAIVSHQKPAVDGPQLAKALRAAGGASIPVILVQPASNAPRPADLALRSGLARKPLSASRLLDAIIATLGPARHEPSPTAPNSPTFELDILLVEDNLMNQRLSLKILESLGYKAAVATDGARAVEMVDRQHYDVVFMDVHMPVLDGLQATRMICRKLPSPKRPFIIGLTANALPGDREMCLRAGMDEYMPKPLDPHRLTALLETAGRRAGRARKARNADPVRENKGLEIAS